MHQLFSEKKARELGTADNLETTSDLLSSKIQEAKVFVKAMRVFV